MRTQNNYAKIMLKISIAQALFELDVAIKNEHLTNSLISEDGVQVSTKRDPPMINLPTRQAKKVYHPNEVIRGKPSMCEG